MPTRLTLIMAAALAGYALLALAARAQEPAAAGGRHPCFSGVYPHLAPRTSGGCVCKEARFDLDDFGRLYVPDVLDFCIRIYDNAGNLIGRCGYYGNADSAGKGSPLPEPPIAFGWPMTCGVNKAGRLYVGDILNQRIVGVDLGGAVEETAAVK